MKGYGFVLEVNVSASSRFKEKIFYLFIILITQRKLNHVILDKEDKFNSAQHKRGHPIYSRMLFKNASINHL